MIYYRTHASRTDDRRPPELADWVSPGEDACLSENVIGEYRYVAVTPPMVFNPPLDAAWVPVAPGWEMAVAGDTVLNHLARTACKFKVAVATVNGNDWIIPHILDQKGNRFFTIVYGGDDFKPMLTDQQQELLALAQEVRVCHETKNWPEVSTKAKWAAKFLSVPYCMSIKTIGQLAILDDELIDAVLMTACGYYTDE